MHLSPECAGNRPKTAKNSELPGARRCSRPLAGAAGARDATPVDDGKPLGKACRNCAAALSGEWCSACGERRWRASDRSLGALAHEAFSALTDWDGRILGSLRALLLSPGRLSADWIDGRRRRWLGPMALFLLANVACFLAAPMTDFDLSLRDQVDLQPHRALVEASCAHLRQTCG